MEEQTYLERQGLVRKKDDTVYNQRGCEYKPYNGLGHANTQKMLMLYAPRGIALPYSYIGFYEQDEMEINGVKNEAINLHLHNGMAIQIIGNNLGELFTLIAKHNVEYIHVFQQEFIKNKNNTTMIHAIEILRPE